MEELFKPIDKGSSSPSAAFFPCSDFSGLLLFRPMETESKLLLRIQFEFELVARSSSSVAGEESAGKLTYANGQCQPITITSLHMNVVFLTKR